MLNNLCLTTTFIGNIELTSNILDKLNIAFKIDLKRKQTSEECSCERIVFYIYNVLHQLLGFLVKMF